MRTFALFALAAVLAAPSYAQESASDDTAPPPDVSAEEEPAPTPKPEKLEWVDVLYSRSFGPLMSKETFRFDAATEYSDSSWSSVELRWNKMPENSKRFKIETGIGLLFEQYKLTGTRQLHGGSSASQTKLFVISGRQYFLALRDRGMQGYGAVDLGIGCELSTHKVLDAPTGLYSDVQERARWLAYPGLAFGVRIRPVKWLLLNGEVRGRFLIAATIVPALQATYGVGISY